MDFCDISDNGNKIGTPNSKNRQYNGGNHNRQCSMITPNTGNNNDPNSCKRNGDNTIFYKGNCGWDDKYGYRNSHIMMTIESGTDIIILPSESKDNGKGLKYTIPDSKDRNSTCSDDNSVDGSNSKDSE